MKTIALHRNAAHEGIGPLYVDADASAGELMDEIDKRIEQGSGIASLLVGYNPNNEPQIVDNAISSVGWLLRDLLEQIETLATQLGDLAPPSKARIELLAKTEGLKPSA